MKPPAARHWLLVGMAAGLATALVSVVEPGRPPLPDDVAAQVGDEPITAAELAKAVGGLERERRRRLEPAEVRQTLGRLVDERLLLAHARDTGLATSSPRLRRILVDEVLQGVRAEAETLEPDETELRAFWRQHADYFRQRRDDPESVPPFDEVREQVLREWRRREGEKLLAELLAAQRQLTGVRIRAELQADP